ncbi:MAG: sugar-binding domain-containing protein [Phycisphaerae bacterium]|jgi:beta-mannosidase
MEKQTLSLNGQWQYKEYPDSARRMRDLDGADWLDCAVPSSIYDCLVKSEKINLFDLRANPQDFLWPSEKAWLFQKFFDCPAELLGLDKIEIVFAGLDTFCQIWLNDKLIGRAENMFCSFRFDVKNLLKEKNNRLLVKCESALENGVRLMNRFGKLSQDVCSFPQRAYVRKAQCQFGWDWAPRLPGCGIWQSVEIEGYKSGKICDVHIRTINADANLADIKISVQIEKFVEASPAFCKLAIFDSTGNIAAEGKLDFSGSDKKISTVLKIKNPAIWFPAGYGSQPIYTLKTELAIDNKQTQTVTNTFGVRTVQINQSPDEFGSPFQFIVNGLPIYARGAAWIPASLFIGSTTEADYEKLLIAAKNANINILRVWGGGIYETDAFYNICDRLGIIVWQDFTFACAYYPDRTWFTDAVKIETAQNITRLRNHPSLVIWCGNNEIDWMHANSWMGKSKKFYGRDIYHKLLPQIAAELDPDRDYITSAPLGSAKNPNEPSTGTVHQWEVWSGVKPTDDYLKQIPRFVDEFGFQALPDKKTLKSFVPDKKLHPASWEIEKHDYQPAGMQKLHHYINELFRPAATLDEFIYLSQVTQARAIKKNAEHLRTNSKINSGALYWQFNDCCPSISWSCLDYQLRPKALYYYTKRFFAPVIATIQPQNSTAAVINHSSSPLTGLFTCRLCDLNLKTLDEFQRPVSASPSEISTITLPQSFVGTQKAGNCPYFLYFTITNSDGVITENSFFHQPDKYIDWLVHDMNVQTQRVDDYNWLLKLTPACAIKDLFIDLPFDVHLSDNFFDLLTDKTKTVKIKTNEMIQDLKQKMTFTSVNSIFSA